KFGFEDTERTHVRSGLGEAIKFVGARTSRREQHWNWMPRMRLHRAWRGMVARDREHIGFLPQQDRKRRVQILDCFFLGVEVSVLAMHIGVLVMDEEIIVVVVGLEVFLELLSDG